MDQQKSSSMPTNSKKNSPIQHQQKGGKKKIYKVTAPAELLSLDSKSPAENIAFVESIRMEAYDCGATFMDFRIVNKVAEFESDSRQFSYEFYQRMLGIISDISNSLREKCKISRL
jgi:hypothetical protein